MRAVEVLAKFGSGSHQHHLWLVGHSTSYAQTKLSNNGQRYMNCAPSQCACYTLLHTVPDVAIFSVLFGMPCAACVPCLWNSLFHSLV
jgi:hypothetical protein